MALADADPEMVEPGEADDQPAERYADTLRAYEHAKREQLASEGPDPLRRELAALVRFLGSEDDPYLQNVDVDIGFRKAKARVLRRLLTEAERSNEQAD